ncbi:MAG: hypothetical protein WBP89_01115, partial [Sedimenticolaceae bacterium]
LFNLAIDSKLRSCDLVRIRVGDVAHAGGTDGAAGFPLGLQSKRALVEQWREPHEPSLPEVLL